MILCPPLEALVSNCENRGTDASSPALFIHAHFISIFWASEHQIALKIYIISAIIWQSYRHLSVP